MRTIKNFKYLVGSQLALEKNITSKTKNNKLYQKYYLLKSLFKPSTVKGIIFLKKHKYVLPSLEIPVTVRCSLNCKHCANLMQYYPKEMRKDVPLSQLIREIETVLEKVDFIYLITLIGGEPFIYKELLTVIKVLEDSKKVMRINIVTNGTIVQKDDFFREVSLKNVTVSISNYGSLAKNKSTLIEKLNYFSVPYRTADEEMTWLNFGKVEFYERTNEEYKKQFLTCKSVCRTYYKGRIHVCPRSSHGMDLNMIPDISNDYIDVLKENLSKEEFLDAFNKLEQQDYIEACKYCKKGLIDCEVVLPAEQMEWI